MPFIPGGCDMLDEEWEVERPSDVLVKDHVATYEVPPDNL